MTSSQPPITLGRVASVEEFYQQLSEKLFHGARPIRNADALADLLQEAGVEKVNVEGWEIPLNKALIIFQVFADLQISLDLDGALPASE